MNLSWIQGFECAPRRRQVERGSSKQLRDATPRDRPFAALSGPRTHGSVAQPLHVPPRRPGNPLLLSKEAWSQDGRSPRRRDVPSPELIWQHSRR